MQIKKPGLSNPAFYYQLIPLKNLFQRILLNMDLCLSRESHRNQALPTIWSSGTKPQYLESKESCLLSPIIK